MKELEWVACKGCGKTGWLDVNLPTKLTGWHSKSMGSEDNEYTFFLCDDCYCLNCPHADTFMAEDFDGKHPDYYCHYPDWNDAMCVHLSTESVET